MDSNRRGNCYASFTAKATGRMEHAPVVDLDQAMHDRIGEVFSEVVVRCNYTVWACSIGANHAHLCVRMHRDRYQKMWENLTAQVRTTFVAEGLVGAAHPVWAQRPYSVWLHTPEDIQARNSEVHSRKIPEKEGLLRQEWGFVPSLRRRNSLKSNGSRRRKRVT